MADLRAELHTVRALDPGESIGELVTVDRISLRQTITADPAIALPTHIRHTPIARRGRDAGDSNRRRQVRTHRHLLSKELRVAMVCTEHIHSR